MSSTSTTPPYAAADTSSTPAPSQQFVPVMAATSQPQSTESGFNFSDWGLMVVGMALTGVIGFFSSLIAVKSDIAANKENISVIKVQVEHLDKSVSALEIDIKNSGDTSQKAEILEVRINGIEKRFERHVSETNRITNKSNGTQ